MVRQKPRTRGSLLSVLSKSLSFRIKKVGKNDININPTLSLPKIIYSLLHPVGNIQFQHRENEAKYYQEYENEHRMRLDLIECLKFHKTASEEVLKLLLPAQLEEFQAKIESDFILLKRKPMTHLDLWFYSDWISYMVIEYGKKVGETDLNNIARSKAISFGVIQDAIEFTVDQCQLNDEIVVLPRGAIQPATKFLTETFISSFWLSALESKPNWKTLIIPTEILSTYLLWSTQNYKIEENIPNKPSHSVGVLVKRGLIKGIERITIEIIDANDSFEKSKEKASEVHNKCFGDIYIALRDELSFLYPTYKISKRQHKTLQKKQAQDSNDCGLYVIYWLLCFLKGEELNATFEKGFRNEYRKKLHALFSQPGFYDYKLRTN